MKLNDRKYLEQALTLAAQSEEPIKCASLLVNSDGKIIARAINTQRKDNFTASHAEMKAIADANGRLGRKLHGITAYGNCEPCTMCLTALIFAGVDRIVFAKRLNDLVPEDQKIHIDYLDFVKKFPYQPKIELYKI